MLVEEVMKKEVITLPSHARIETALNLLNKYHIRHIPIVNDEKEILGIVSDRDVRDASPSIFDQNHSKQLKNEIQTIMSKPVITVHPLDFVEEVAGIFYENEIACVPVTKNNKLIGIVTEKDVLYTLIQLTGIHEQSSQLEIRVEDKIGTLPKITNLIGEYKINISSVLIYPDKREPNKKIIVFRIQTMNPIPVIESLKNDDYEVLWPNISGVKQ
ncbi:acetoin utilization protein AcuB [Salinibacillus kushneri]|uniref:Acetoin utilization protein AcuB n=1 Tax=Salinibacillus kushneri TaxID=237682 RepID=A0A1I0JBY0_9BACI|nr:acetoin utilization AcuB family protein [Salinibacillus kushneri]SEU07518.1 acetoin utilization protein AcuB [Salinibacillus kushneri]